MMSNVTPSSKSPIRNPQHPPSPQLKLSQKIMSNLNETFRIDPLALWNTGGGVLQKTSKLRVEQQNLGESFSGPRTTQFHQGPPWKRSRWTGKRGTRWTSTSRGGGPHESVNFFELSSQTLEIASLGIYLQHSITK